MKDDISGLEKTTSLAWKNEDISGLEKTTSPSLKNDDILPDDDISGGHVGDDIGEAVAEDRDLVVPHEGEARAFLHSGPEKGENGRQKR